MNREITRRSTNASFEKHGNQDLFQSFEGAETTVVNLPKLKIKFGKNKLNY